ncbi:unnamed protein product [Protopolystoma xenopodis]|uniref:Uncharacterized protein n=1 Tax=Protopolystoma xenopodis TaxID=117903 RepID=A0A3S5BMG1_9PLAT|nr:unnamed protein product [Protopolystoma xenopodis]
MRRGGRNWAVVSIAGTFQKQRVEAKGRRGGRQVLSAYCLVWSECRLLIGAGFGWASASDWCRPIDTRLGAGNHSLPGPMAGLGTAGENCSADRRMSHAA